jgi:hypothetical protein
VLDPLRRYFGSPPARNYGAGVRTVLLSRILNFHILVALGVGLFYRPR